LIALIAASCLIGVTFAQQPGQPTSVRSENLPPKTDSPGKPLLLPEMTWMDVKDYLAQSDMVIIPLGSIEQHGPHLPLGTDTIGAMSISKRISARTGVVVAPVLWVGYSPYHAGFPGTLSLQPETMERVLFEVAEYLIRHGFGRIMFWNGHGGNGIVQRTVIHQINHRTEAVAVAIGLGSPIQKDEPSETLDYHAGVAETSEMLALAPELVRIGRAQKPEMHFTPKMEELRQLSKKDPALIPVWESLLWVPAETKKGGTSHEVSSNGVWSLDDPRKATAEVGEKEVQDQVERAVRFIEAWKKARIR
jgi:creatinine amidohydrolase